MIGPLVFFSEYRDFINGTNYDKPNPSKVSNVSMCGYNKTSIVI